MAHMPDDTMPTGPGQDTDRLTVADAAERLGVTHDAIRARLRRGTLEGEKEGDHWYVFLPRDAGQDTDATATGHDTTPAVALVEQMQSEVDYLRAELTAARIQAAQERERADVLQREALDRLQAMIPIALGPPQSPETGDTTPTGLQTPQHDTGTATGALGRLLRWFRGG